MKVEQAVKELERAIQYIDNEYSCDDRVLKCPNPDGLAIALNVLKGEINAPNNKTILDPCCGGKQFWFNKNNPDALYQDIRKETVYWNEDNGHPKRKLEIDPDVIGDFTNMEFKDNTFSLVVFDPPHFNKLGNNSRTAKMYGKLLPTWEDDIRAGFSECFRVLNPNGTLVFKWNSTQIKVKDILELAEYSPLFGHTSGKRAKTHWITFMKSESQRKEAIHGLSQN